MFHLKWFKFIHGFWHPSRIYIYCRWRTGWRCRWPIFFSIINGCTIWVYIYAHNFRCHIPSWSTAWFSRLPSCNFFFWHQLLDNIYSLGVKKCLSLWTWNHKQVYQLPLISTTWICCWAMLRDWALHKDTYLGWALLIISTWTRIDETLYIWARIYTWLPLPNSTSSTTVINRFKAHIGVLA